jgi:hypothetical protein
MLTQRVPALCEQCHENGGSMGGSPFHMYGRACLNCHPSIHGSNGLKSANGCSFRE